MALLPQPWSLGGTDCNFWVDFNKGCVAELVPRRSDSCVAGQAGCSCLV